MMRSMYSGVAGLKTHQTKMDVIGNNIANVNTVAFKSQSVTFSELMYQTTQNASGANAVTGTAGINARQIGLGVKTGAINTAISSQGASQTTNNPFDIRITGSAFFVVSNGQNNFFTRDGSFYVDGLGNLAMTSNGYNVMGWQVDPETMDIKQETVSPLRIMSAENMTYDPEATTKARITGIVDKLDTNLTSSSGKNMNLLFYDKLGYSYTAKINLKTTDKEGMYAVTIDSIVDADNNAIDLSPIGSDVLNTASTLDKPGETTVQSNLISSLEAALAAAPIKNDGTAITTTDSAGETQTIVAANEVVYSVGQTDTIDWDKLAAVLQKSYNLDAGMTGDKLQTLRFTYTDKSGTSEQEITFTAADLLNGNRKFKLGDGTTEVTAMQMFKDPTIGSTFANNTVLAETTTNLYYNIATGKFEGIGARGVDNTTITLNIEALKSLNPATNTMESNFMNIKIDFSPTTMFNNSGTSTIAASSGDENKLGAGRKLGKMSGVSIQDDGRIYASYDNGMSRLLGQIAVAEFANASGLEKEGDNLYKASQNSGDFDGIGIDIKSGGGYMTTGVLEMSNVDLSAEFTDMITTQRGFQANSRIITVSDTLLEELVNLKR